MMNIQEVKPFILEAINCTRKEDLNKPISSIGADDLLITDNLFYKDHFWVVDPTLPSILFDVVISEVVVHVTWCEVTEMYRYIIRFDYER